MKKAIGSDSSGEWASIQSSRLPQGSLAWRHRWTIGLGSAVVIGLYLTSRYSYLLFHSLAEIFSVVVAFSIFMIAWTSRRYIENGYLLFVGIAYLALGLLDLLHTMGYTGMSIFPGHDFVANQLWIAARFMESLALLVAFAYISANRRPNPALLLGAFALVTGLVIAAIFVWRIFPACFLAGQGQTRFKILSEYLIIAILAVDAGLLVFNRSRFHRSTYQPLLGATILAILTEASFTVYVSNYGFSNLVGHLLKVLSYYLIYVAIVKTAVERPYELVFRELTTANTRLKLEVEAHRATEKEREKAMGDLQTTLDEIQVLRGVIPICSHCKNIRDDHGAWNQLEAYIRDHSSATFTHGICPNCIKKHFPKSLLKGTV